MPRPHPDSMATQTRMFAAMTALTPAMHMGRHSSHRASSALRTKAGLEGGEEEGCWKTRGNVVEQEHLLHRHVVSLRQQRSWGMTRQVHHGRFP